MSQIIVSLLSQTINILPGVLEILADERKTIADGLLLKTVEVNGFGELAYEHGNYEFKKESTVVDNGK